MKKWLLHIMLVGVLGMLAASCSQDEVVQQAGDDVINVTFTLMMSDPNSRALEGHITSENQGNAYENRIDAGGLQVLFYSTDLSTCFGKVENISLFKTEDNHIYRFIGDLKVTGASVSENGLACKVMVFANCPNVETTTTLATLEYVYAADDFKNESKNIPMWGVATFTNNGTTDNRLHLNPGEQEDLGTINLLRSMAKVEVIMGEEAAKKYDLANVTLKGGYHTEGLCLPKSYNSASVTTDMNTSAEMFNVTNDLTSVETDLGFKAITENKQYVLYLPEHAVTTGSKIEVTVLNKGSKTEGPNLNGKNFIYFKKYTDGTTSESAESFNIVRNFHYQYIIRSVKEDAPLTLTLTASPWNLVESELHYKTQGAAKQTITWGEGVKPNDDKQIVLDATNSSATFSFELSTPTGATWYATLVPMGGDENAFSFSDTEVVTTESGPVGKKSGTISIHAVNTTGVVEDNNVARLEIIVVTNDGRTINVTDMLGGQYTIMQAKTEE